MSIYSAIDAVRKATRGTEYENRLFMVGGIVRDQVMGLPPSEDVDMVLEGDALILARFLFRKGVTKHRPVTYPRFGTAMLLIGGNTIEFVSARSESYAPTSRKPDVVPATLYDDIMRRDFTINTLLENLHTGGIQDLTGKGCEDIRNGIIRTPTEPASTFYDDPLRMLRAVRFAVRFGFTIEARTWEAIKSEASRLQIISKERIRDEFVKILLSSRSAQGLRMLREVGLLQQFAPELTKMVGVTQRDGHIYDVWEHTLHALEFLPSDADLVLRLAVLLHDIGKPETRVEDAEGHTHFYGHDDLGMVLARKLLTRLRFPSSKIARVVRLIGMHMRIGEYRSEWKDSAVKRLMRDAHHDVDDLLALAIADRLGANPHASVADLEELRQRIQGILTHVDIAELESPLNGKEIMDLLGIPPGKKVQEVKDYLCEHVIEGRLSPGDKETARKMALERFGRHS